MTRMAHRVRMGLLLATVAILTAPPASAQRNGNYPVQEMNFDLWCQEQAGLPADRCDKRTAQDEAAFLNVGANGPETPGPDVDASRWLANERAISGFGVETVGIDAGAAGGFDPPFPLHNFLLGAGRLGLTQLANLDKLPLTGALIVVSPLKLVGGTGSPSRVFALVPKG